MCSVVGCYSKRRTHKPQLFKLPEDPERRLQWVMFLAAANKQRFKESSWTDITICSDHFKYDSFEVITPRHTGKLQMSLKPGAVPSLWPHSEAERLEAHLKSLMSATAATDYTHSNITGIPEVVAVFKAPRDPVDVKKLSGDEGDMESDKEIKSEEEESDDHPPPVPTDNELCTECGMFFNKLKSHTCEHKIKPFSCLICGERCISEAALIVHSRIHNENYEHQCKYCHVTFKTKADKMSHEQNHSTEEKPYKCPDCSETFATNKARNIHLVDHRGPRQSKCPFCGIQFNRSLYLRRHLLVHTGEKPFKCSVCDRGFKQASHLKSHIRLHTGERPFKCQHCDKSFNHNVSLKSHLQRYHTSKSGGEQKKERINEAERESDAGDAEDYGRERDTDSGLSQGRPKHQRKGTGRPKGRPKGKESGNLVLEVQVEGQCSDRKAGKQQPQRLKRTKCVDEERNDESSDNDKSFGSAEVEEEWSDNERTSEERPKKSDSDSDSDFDPEERKKKRHSSQKSGKSSGKRRGRPRKNLVV